MKLKLKLKEMFVLSKLINISDIIAYRASLTKLYYEMIEIDDFAELISLLEELSKNQKRIFEEFKNNQSLSESELNEIKDKLNNELKQINDTLSPKISEKIQNEELEFEFNFNELLKNAIKNIVENQDLTIQKLGLNKQMSDILINLYLKIMES